MCYLSSGSLYKKKAVKTSIIAYVFSLAPLGSRHSGSKSPAGVSKGEGLQWAEQQE